MTSASDVAGDDEISYRAQLDYNSDRYGVQVERLVVGGDFNPEVGFLRRDDFDRRFGLINAVRPRYVVGTTAVLTHDVCDMTCVWQDYGRCFQE